MTGVCTLCSRFIHTVSLLLQLFSSAGDNDHRRVFKSTLFTSYTISNVNKTEKMIKSATIVESFDSECTP